MITSCEPDVAAGTSIVGKWNGNRYTVERLLGKGANGVVYLVRRGSETFALKLGFDAVDLQMEVNALASLSARQSGRFAREPYMVEADDYQSKGMTHPFYVMRYVTGLHAWQFLRERGQAWLPLLGYSILCRLREIQESGFAFGDLKAENMLISSYGAAELIDYGGVTPLGRSVKQYTEIYDRGFWNAGSRTADAGYDLFAFAVLYLQLAGCREQVLQASRRQPQSRRPSELAALVDGCPACRPVAELLKRALLGQYATLAQACGDWRALARKPAPPVMARAGVWVEAVFATSLVLLGATLFYIHI